MLEGCTVALKYRMILTLFLADLRWHLEKVLILKAAPSVLFDNPYQIIAKDLKKNGVDCELFSISIHNPTVAHGGATGS